MTSTAFADHHDQLVGMAKGIVATVSTGSSEALRDLPAQRMALSKMVNVHCGEEIALINAHAPRLRDDPAKTALIRRFHDELLAWRGDLMECNASWPQRKVTSDPDGFLTVFNGLSERLQARVRWEEKAFYPAVLGRMVRGNA
ncbi:hypothetical protein [Blastomonas sp. AAP53]|uniref:hypothetical protein n=1 Tax=Blastomonas sp. AAP53 TaxID=1248760 RepID=UPI0002D7FC83|nr:hypothetical protein [Blastomonas sp. AAP53]